LARCWRILPAEQRRENAALAARMRIRSNGGGDYCNHLLHHLHQILELEPIAIRRGMARGSQPAMGREAGAKISTCSKARMKLVPSPLCEVTSMVALWD